VGDAVAGLAVPADQGQPIRPAGNLKAIVAEFPHRQPQRSGLRAATDVNAQQAGRHFRRTGHHRQGRTGAPLQVLPEFIRGVPHHWRCLRRDHQRRRWFPGGHNTQGQGRSGQTNDKTQQQSDDIFAHPDPSTLVCN